MPKHYKHTETKSRQYELKSREPQHKWRVWLSSAERDLYTWKCSCGMTGDPDFLCAEYADDDAREAHGLEPQINIPLL